MRTKNQRSMKLLFLFCSCFFLLSSTFSQVSPLISTTWNQGCYYNEDCPVSAGGPCGKAYTGCNATAISQILKYFSHPASAWGGIYTNSGSPVQTVDFSNATYNWAAMPLNLSSHNTEIAKIMHHTGVAVNMQYGSSVSNSYFTSEPFKRFFKYSLDVRGIMKSMFTSTEWENIIKHELDNGRPVLVKGGDHFYIIDGYNASNQFHCNFGWGGFYDGYYNIHNVVVTSYNFTPANAIIGILPLSNLEIKGINATDTIHVHSNGGTISYLIASLQSSWTLSSNQTWCTPNLLSGGAGYFTSNEGANAQIDINPGYSTRYSDITITDGTNTNSIVVAQNGITPYLSVTPNNLTFIAAGATQNISVSSDSNWTAHSPDVWLNIAPNSGIGIGTVDIIASPNGPVSRNGTVIFTRGSIIRTVTIFQAAAGSFWCEPAMNTPNNNGITNVTLAGVSRTSSHDEGYVLSNDTILLWIDSTYTLSVTFMNGNAPAVWIDWNINGDFSGVGEAVVAPSSSWYPSFSGTKTMNFTVPANATEGLTRMRVYAKSFGTGPVSGPCNTSDNGGDIEDYHIIVKNSRYIDVSPTLSNHLASADIVNIQIESDSSWTAVASETWVNPSNFSGIGNSITPVIIEDNYSLTPRSCILTFQRAEKQKTVTIHQSGADTILIAFPLHLDFSHTGGLMNVDISSNTEYTINCSESWLTTDIASGSGNTTISTSALFNPFPVSRSATITITSANSSVIITVIQDESVTTEIDTETKPSFFIHPNPTNDIVNISHSETEALFQIFNQNGELILTTTNRTINTYGFSAGIYFITDGKTVIRFIKLHKE